MKRLYIVRHAKSSWKDASLDDFDRPLNKRGKKAAPEMGKRLKKLKVKPDLLLASPAVRAITTAKAIAVRCTARHDGSATVSSNSNHTTGASRRSNQATWPPKTNGNAK